MRIETENLHFAAYIKAHGGTFIGKESGMYAFESDKSFGDWQVAHTNSCCLRTDRELFELKRFK